MYLEYELRAGFNRLIKLLKSSNDYRECVREVTSSFDGINIYKDIQALLDRYQIAEEYYNGLKK